MSWETPFYVAVVAYFIWRLTRLAREQWRLAAPAVYVDPLEERRRVDAMEHECLEPRTPAEWEHLPDCHLCRDILDPPTRSFDPYDDKKWVEPNTHRQVVVMGTPTAKRMKPGHIVPHFIYDGEGVWVEPEERQTW